jgi:hypothetical protein
VWCGCDCPMPTCEVRSTMNGKHLTQNFMNGKTLKGANSSLDRLRLEQVDEVPSRDNAMLGKPPRNNTENCKI